MKVKKRYFINNRMTDTLLKERLTAEAKSFIQSEIFTIRLIAALSENPEEVYKHFTINNEHNPLL